ncbi:MAG TPA: response regulator, partial [Rhodanobacter sp.]
LPQGRALVLDNEPAALAAMGVLLASWHWQVHEARTPAQAEQAPWTPDLLVLDYHLDGGLTGLDALARLRERYGALPAVMLTADRDAALRQRLLEAGVSVLYKPLKPLALRQLIQHHMAAREAASTPA